MRFLRMINIGLVSMVLLVLGIGNPLRHHQGVTYGRGFTRLILMV